MWEAVGCCAHASSSFLLNFKQDVDKFQLNLCVLKVMVVRLPTRLQFGLEGESVVEDPSALYSDYASSFI